MDWYKFQMFMSWCVLLPIVVCLELYIWQTWKKLAEYKRQFNNINSNFQLDTIAHWCRLYSAGHDKLNRLTLQGMLDKSEMDLDKKWKEFLSRRGYDI